VRAAAAGADRLSRLADYLRPVPIAGEVLRFDLSTYRSTVTREMLQVRLRMTPAAFAVGAELLAANLAGDAVEVDAGALSAANAEVGSRLAGGPEWAVLYLRAFAATRRRLDRRARQPGRITPYVLAAAHYQALGALKFCLPDSLRPRLLAALEEPALVDALLAPDGPSLWHDMRAGELALARLRERGPAERYRRRLGTYRRQYGYLYAEDVDFRRHETLDALDARIAAVPTSDARRRTEARGADQARKREARRRFAETSHDATLVSQVLLARALTAHEDLNRRAKMRLLRDLRDVAEPAGLDIERDGLETIATVAQPVLPSS
jgi:hypothetical protein